MSVASTSTASFCRAPALSGLTKNITSILEARNSGSSSSTTKPLPKIEDVKLILSDVDGTLLNDAHEVHPRTSEAIRYLRSTYPHIPIVPVTGKQRVSCEYVARVCGLEDMPSGCCHGSIIYTPEGTIEKVTGIDPKIVVGVTDFLKAQNKSVFIYEHDSVNCVFLEDHPSLNFYEVTRGYDPAIKDVRGTDYMSRVASGEVVCTKMFLPMEVELVVEHMDMLNKAFSNGADYRMTRALPDIIELIPASIDKSVALAHFSQMYGVDPANIITFGDGENDVGMFRASGMSVSMGNAMPVPASASDYSTLSNNEGGVGLFLDSIFRPDHVPGKDVRTGLDSGYSSNVVSRAHSPTHV